MTLCLIYFRGKKCLNEPQFKRKIILFYFIKNTKRFPTWQTSHHWPFTISKALVLSAKGLLAQFMPMIAFSMPWELSQEISGSPNLKSSNHVHSHLPRWKLIQEWKISLTANVQINATRTQNFNCEHYFQIEVDNRIIMVNLGKIMWLTDSITKRITLHDSVINCTLSYLWHTPYSNISLFHTKRDCPLKRLSSCDPWS